MALRVASWNINSVRLRIDLLARLAVEQQPDVICLQETKAEDAAFPHDAIAAMGYGHRLVWGMKSYNGVAILSRLPFDDEVLYRRCGRDDCRHIMARIDGIELHCLYIPAGGDVPDAAVNDKFAHKLDFLREATGFFAGRASNALLAGDLNIAPLEHDVWSHKQLLTVVSHTPVEVALLNRMQSSGNFIDAVRHFVPATEKLYSWWSYRARDWAASDRGRRLDHIWLTADLAPRLRAARILRDMRGWEKASDHVPVLIDLA